MKSSLAIILYGILIIFGTIYVLQPQVLLSIPVVTSIEELRIAIGSSGIYSGFMYILGGLLLAGLENMTEKRKEGALPTEDPCLKPVTESMEELSKKDFPRCQNRAPLV